MILIFEMEKNIKIKLFEKSNLSSVLALIESSDHTNREKISWVSKNMTAVLAFRNSELIGAIPFEQHKIKKSENTDIQALWVSAAYIKPRYRSMGIGSSMDAMIKKLCSDKKYVLVMRHDEGSLAFKWYKKNGYSVLNEIISLKISEKNIGKRLNNNYNLISSFNDIKKISPSLLKSFNYYNYFHYNFPKRTLRSWSDKLKFHYYKKSYEYNLIITSSNNGPDNFAVVGITSIKDDILRVDILELSCAKKFSEFENLITSIFHFGKIRKVEEIRVQVALKDYYYNYFNKLKFTKRWKTNLMGKALSKDIKLDPLNTRFFQIDYI